MSKPKAGGFRQQINSLKAELRVLRSENEVLKTDNGRLKGELLAKRDLTFNQLREANIKRLPLFRNKMGELSHPKPDGSDWSITQWTNAVAGAVGEACNISKKMASGDYGQPGSDDYKKAQFELAKEFADVVVYSDIACLQVGWDLGGIVAYQFNEVSERVRCGVRL